MRRPYALTIAALTYLSLFCLIASLTGCEQVRWEDRVRVISVTQSQDGKRWVTTLQSTNPEHPYRYVKWGKLGEVGDEFTITDAWGRQ